MTATVVALLGTPPTAVDIDRLAMEFLALEEKTDQAYAIALAVDEPHEKMKERLIDLVEEFGSAGNGKSKLEKSKLLHGLTHELVATFGVSTSINTAAVDRFADVLCIVISSGQELGPTHVSLRAVAAIMITSLDSPWKGEQDAQSISRCFTAHH